MERGLIAERKNWQQLRYRWLIDSRAEFLNFLLRHCPAFVRRYVYFSFLFLSDSAILSKLRNTCMFEKKKERFKRTHRIIRIIHDEYTFERIFFREWLETAFEPRRRLIFRVRLASSGSRLSWSRLSLPSNIVSATCELGRLN